MSDPGTRPATEGHPASGATIVLVEDHDQLRTLLVRVLSGAGHRVVAAVDTAREGEQEVLAHRPDVAVIDNQLPDGLGVDLCRRLAQAAPDVFLLLHTGVATEALALQAVQAGVVVVPKATRADDLLAAIGDRPRRRPT